MGSKKGAFVTVISVIVALIVALATIQSTQASIDYWLQKTTTFSAGLNQITVYCRNGGGMDGDFNLVVKFTNATFTEHTELPFSMVDDSTIKIKFVLHKGDSNQKDLFFVANGSNQFSISVSLESISFIQFVKANTLFPTQLPYKWNATSQVYICCDPQ